MIKNIIKFFVLILIICAAAYSVLKYNDKLSVDNPRMYKQGIDFFNQGDYQNAYYNFSKVNNFSPLYNIAILRQAQCADRIQNYETAEEKYKKYLELSPKTIFSDSARYNLAKTLFYEKKYEEARAEFLKLYNSVVKNDYSIGSRYFLGLIDKSENKDSAKKFFLEYIDELTTGKNSLNCADELANYSSELTSDENFAVGKVYFDNKHFEDSLSYFYKVPIEKSWAYLAIANMNLNNREIAKKQIKTGIEKYTKDTDKELLERAYNLYAETIGKTKQKGWEMLLELVNANNSEGKDYVLYNYAQALPLEKAKGIYSRILNDYPQSDYAPNSCWYEFWSNYTSGNYDDALKIGEKYLKDYQKSTATPKILYWMGKTYLKKNDKQSANSYFIKITNIYPDSYYAFRTYLLTHNMQNKKIVNKNKVIPDKEVEIDFPINYSNIIDINDLKLINTLLELGDTEVWTEADFGNKVVESWFALKRGQIQRSMVLARDAIEEMSVKPPFNSVVYLLAYPKYYVEDINNKANEYSLSPYLVMSLMKEESYFNPNATSSSNAQGLMQLMPATAGYIAEKYSLSKDLAKDLYNSDANITLGCAYLNYLDKYFDENDLLSIIAYNAGNGSVKKWLDTLKYSDYDEFIENIPYKESRNYVKKVYRSYWNYINIYK